MQILHNHTNEHVHLISTFILGLNEFDSLGSSEVNDFRMRMRCLAEESALKRSQSSRLEKLRHRYPPRLADSKAVPVTLSNHLSSGNCFILNTKVENTEVSVIMQHDYV